MDSAKTKKACKPIVYKSLNNFVVLLGLEPSQTVPKTGVLPLHHRTITTIAFRLSFASAKVVGFIYFCK